MWHEFKLIYSLKVSLYMIVFVSFFIVFQAHADHFDLVSRRMGFIPLPLGSLVSYSDVVSFPVTIVTTTK